MHIVFTGGGTAGHINPALAVAGYLKQIRPDTKISYIGTVGKLECQLVPAAGYDFYTIDAAGFQRKLTFDAFKKNITAVKKAVSSSNKAKKLLKELSPDIVVGTGGYVCGPVLREAIKLKIPAAIHEANAYPGVTTKILAPRLDSVMLAYKDAAKYLKCKNPPVVTGNPVRVEILHSDRKKARAELGLDERPMLLSFGGSLGARPLNEACVPLIADNGGRYYHYHATGKAGYKQMMANLKADGITEPADTVHISEYINNMSVLMAAADLVICRGGALTVSELPACAKPAIIIPSPYVAENHQFHNAMSLKNRGAAEVIEEKDLNGEVLKNHVEQILFDPAKLKSMSENSKKCAITDANKRIVEVIDSLLNR